MSFQKCYFRFIPKREYEQVKIPVSESFFSRLQKAAEARGMPLTRLSAETKVALSTMYRWKESAPHDRTCSQIAAALRVSETWLREGIGEMEISEPLREGVATYHFTPRGGSGTGPNPQPSSADEWLRVCHLLLDHFGHINSPDALDYAMAGIHDALSKYKAAKASEL